MKINQILGLKQKTLEANEASRVKNQKKSGAGGIRTHVQTYSP